MARDLIVSSNPRETRVALLEDGVVAELFLEREAQRGIVGSIYKGRVTRVLPGMQSAFVDLGLERDAFLHAADVFAELPRQRALRRGEVQRGAQRADRGAAARGRGAGGAGAQGADGHQGRAHHLARLAAGPLPGADADRRARRRLAQDHDDEERRRLKTVLKEFRQERGGGGLIARTAGQGREAEAFLRDGRYLSRTWDEVRALAARQRAPVLLYREPSLVERLLRDLLSDETWPRSSSTASATSSARSSW